eukprot:5950907-Amphidinium_carterae.1
MLQVSAVGVDLSVSRYVRAHHQANPQLMHRQCVGDAHATVLGHPPKLSFVRAVRLQPTGEKLRAEAKDQCNGKLACPHEEHKSEDWASLTNN